MKDVQHIFIRFMVTCIFLAGLCSCTETEKMQSSLTGTLRGKVVCNPESIVPPDDLSGVTIIIEGTNPLLSVQANTDGTYTVPDLPAGTYDVVFRRNGYGEHRIIGFSFVGGEQPAWLEANIYKLPIVYDMNLEFDVEKNPSGYLFYTGKLTYSIPEGNETVTMFRYYIGTTPNVSAYEYEETGYQFTSSILNYNHIEGTLDKQKYLPGSDVYFVMYPCAEPYAYFINLESGKKIYTSLSPIATEIKHVVIP